MVSFIVNKFSIDTTIEYGGYGSGQTVTTISSTFAPEPPNVSKENVECEPVTVKSILLPHATDVPYWRVNSIIDPLEILTRFDVIDAFNTPAVIAILHHRWRKIRPFFYIQIGLYLIYVALCTAFSIHLANDETGKSLSTIYESASDLTYVAIGIIILVLNVWFLYGELSELYEFKLLYFSDPWNYLDLPGHILVFAVAFLHGFRDANEFPVTAITVILNYSKLLSFFRGFRGSGIFTRLVLKILIEIRYFLLVWAVVLFGFANAYIVLFQGSNSFYQSSGDLHFLNLGTAFVSMFKGSTGGGLDLIFAGDSQYPNGAQAGLHFPIANTELYNLQLVLYVLVTLICNVLLLNLLIALMTSIYNDAKSRASAQYRMDKTLFMLGMERLLFNFGFKFDREKWVQVSAPRSSY